MVIVQINVSDFGSTGAMVRQFHEVAEATGDLSYCYFGRVTGKLLGERRIGNEADKYYHAAISRIGKNGHGSFLATKKLVRELEVIDPDIIVLQNIHGYYLNLSVFFDFLKHHEKSKIYWYVHDCWLFTGNCAYYSTIKCENWRADVENCRECANCKGYNRAYPKTFINSSHREYRFKRDLFTSLSKDRVTFICPSEWIQNELSKSFLKDYKSVVKKTEPDKDVFYNRSEEEIQEVLEKYNLSKEKKLILGVASVWDGRKQLEIFPKIADLLPDYQVVCVGLSRSQIAKLPKNVIGIKRTENAEELAKFYSAASIFVNPSLEDNYSLVPLEAQSCGAKVVSSNRCGNPETVKNGVVVNDATDPKEYAQKIIELTT